MNYADDFRTERNAALAQRRIKVAARPDGGSWFQMARWESPPSHLPAGAAPRGPENSQWLSPPGIRGFYPPAPPVIWPNLRRELVGEEDIADSEFTWEQ